MDAARRKVYVEVEVTHKVDGSARPNLITFENGEKYEIDRVIHSCVYKGRRHGDTVYGPDMRQADVPLR